MKTSIFVHWKTTAAGLLGVTLPTTAALLALPNIQTLISAKTLLILGAFQAVGRVWIGIISQDAGVVMATTPANPTPHLEPAHEVPDAPAATPVVPKP